MPRGLILKVRKLGKYWWLVGDEEFGPYGPYKDGRKAAVESKRRLYAFMEHKDDPGFITTESRKRGSRIR